MYRIDNPSAVVTLSAPGLPRTPGYFTDGNPAAGLEATIVDAWWMNQIQEEIISVISAASPPIPLNKASHTQLLEALMSIIGQYAGGIEGAFLPLIGGQLRRVNGAADPLLPDSRAMADALARADIRHELHVFDDMPHGFLQMTNLSACLEAQRRMFDFLRRTL